MADAGTPPASPARHSTGSSTNPNTPREVTPDCPDAADDGTVKVDRSPESSTSSSDPRCDIEPTWPTAIDVTKVNALAKWEDQALPKLFFDMHWHPTSNKAFFKLRAWVALLGGERGRKSGASIYLFIYPERIQQLSIDPDPTDKVLGRETWMLSFQMDRPPALVLPKTPCQPRNKAAQNVMSALRTLAKQTCFAVYADIPRRKLAVSRVPQLCAAASGRGLSSLAVHANPSSLFEGQGGQVVEGDGLAGPAPDEGPVNEEPPPQYSEPAEPPPAPRNDLKGKKRRRRSSSSSELDEPVGRKIMQDMLDATLSTLKQHLDDRLAAHRKDVAELLDKTEARVLDILRKEMDQRCDGIQETLEERVHQEMAEVEDNVMRNLSEMPLQATLTFPQHPWY